LHVSLNWSFQNSTGELCKVDVALSVSGDRGLTWDPSVALVEGVGCQFSKLQLWNEKPWIVTDNNPASPHYGRTYVVFPQFVRSRGIYQRSPILEMHSDDGGRKWSTPQVISGSNAQVCTYQVTGPAGECDQSGVPVATIAADGTVYVAFLNDQNLALQEAGEVAEDQYLFVKTTNGGTTWSNPVFVAGLEDGSRDYPLNVRGRQTLSGYQLEVWSAGNIVASPWPADAGKLYLVFSDNRSGTHDAANSVTNSDVFLMTSTDGGSTWTGPTQVDGSTSDQWNPWVDVNPTNGDVGVVYLDRDPADPALYDVALRTRPRGDLPGTKAHVNTAPSHPTHSRFFRAGSAAPGCETCAALLTDLINLAYGPDGTAHVVWTDMRDASDIPGLYSQFVYYAQI
jgi:hypothetical protein